MKYRLCKLGDILLDFASVIAYQISILPLRPRLLWYRFHIPKDEFHKSLDMDLDILLRLEPKDRDKYIKQLCRRRHKAHIRDMARKDKRKKDANGGDRV